jgi:PBP1b-binding outer membrane lipoprotein LpoB
MRLHEAPGKLRLAQRLLPELRTQSERTDVKKVLVMLALAAGVLAGCKKTSNGDVEVQTPRVTTETDTVKMPTVETSKETVTTVTPKVEVKKETSTVTVPKVTVKQKP